MASQLASGNPTAIPLLVALALFVVLLAGLGFAMMRINHVKLRQPRRMWTAAQKSYLKRRTAYYGVGILLGVALFVMIMKNAVVVGRVGAVVTVAWMVFGGRLLGARFMPKTDRREAVDAGAAKRLYRSGRASDHEGAQCVRSQPGVA